MTQAIPTRREIANTTAEIWAALATSIGGVASGAIELPRWWQEDIAPREFRMNGRTLSATEAITAYAKWARGYLSTADLVGCSTDGWELLRHAAEELPSETSPLEAVKSYANHFMWTPTPFGIGSNGLWWVVDGSVLHVSIYHGDQQGEGFAVRQDISLEGTIESCVDSPESPDTEPLVDEAGRVIDLTNMVTRLIVAFCLLANQRILRTSEEAPSRPLRRRLARKTNKVIDLVQIVTLPLQVGSGKAIGGHRDYSHRWIVSGHWRNQYYRRNDIHHPKWITAHVKGPKDKPLVVKEKRYVFDPPTKTE